MPLVAQPVGIWTEESTILVIWVSLLGKEWFFPFKEIIFGLTFATRQLVAQPVGLARFDPTTPSNLVAPTFPRVAKGIGRFFPQHEGLDTPQLFVGHLFF